MLVTFNPIHNSFKGSFKIEDLNAFISDFDESDEEAVKREESQRKRAQEIIEKRTYTPPILIHKRTACQDFDGRVTHVDVYPSVLYSTHKTLPTFIKDICNKEHINPSNDIFMVSGLTDNSKRYVAFNYFYTDKKSGTDCVQVLYCQSEDENLTQFQKSIIKVFNDPRNKKNLCLNSKTNPFVISADKGYSICNTLQSSIAGLECVSKDMLEEDIMDENGKVNPVIYSHDPNGIYTKYRVIYLRN